jgi:hypothetical protein
MIKKLYVILAISMLHGTILHAAAVGSAALYDGTDLISQQKKAVYNAFHNGVRALNAFPSTITPNLKVSEFGSVRENYDKTRIHARVELQAVLRAADSFADRSPLILAAFDGFADRQKAAYSYLFTTIASKTDPALAALPDDRSEYGVAVSEGFSGFESAMYGGGDAGKAAFLTLLNQAQESAYNTAHVMTFNPYLNPNIWGLFAFITGADTVTCGDRAMPYSPAWVKLWQSYSRGEANTLAGYRCESDVIHALAEEATAKGMSLSKTIYKPRVYTKIIGPEELDHSLPPYELMAITISQDEIIAVATRRATGEDAGHLVHIAEEAPAAAAGGGAAAGITAMPS